MSDPSRIPSPSEVPLAPGVWVRKEHLRFSFLRSRGPGGQAVNKLSTAVQLRVLVDDLRGLDEAAAQRLRQLAGQRLTSGDELLFQAQTHRSQIDNRRACVERLAELVRRAAERPRSRRPTKPGRAAVQRRLDAKRRRSEKKSRRRPPEDP